MVKTYENFCSKVKLLTGLPSFLSVADISDLCQLHHCLFIQYPSIKQIIYVYLWILMYIFYFCCVSHVRYALEGSVISPSSGGSPGPV